MIRNLKVLGLALVAVFAMSAVVASSASAQVHKGWLTSDGPVKLTGTENPATLTAFGNQKVECHAHYDIGNVNETPHGFIEPPATEFTIKPTYSNCTASIGTTKAPATVTTNKCDFVVKIGETIELGKWGTTAKVVCENPATEAIEVHAYSSPAHSTTICTVKVAAQEGLTGGFMVNDEEEGAWTVTLGGTFKEIHATKTGVLCGGTSETKTAEQHVDAHITGFNEANEQTDITITDEA
jgi:hypothetical protein